MEKVAVNQFVKRQVEGSGKTSESAIIRMPHKSRGFLENKRSLQHQ